MIRRSLIAVVLLSTAALSPVRARGAAASFDGLLRNSPFAAPAAATPGNRTEFPLEFRGMIVDGGEPFFSIYEVSSKSSLWVGLNEPGNPYRVQGYDGEKGAATIEYQGRTLTIPLKQAKVVTLVQVPQNTGPNPGQPGGPQVFTGSGNPAEESARIAAVSEEIRRRRAMRQQQPGQPTPQNVPTNADFQGPRFTPPTPNQQGPQPQQPAPQPKPARD